MALLRPTPWVSQPQVATEIDWGNPITLGLVAAVNLGGGGTCSVQKQPVTFVNSPSYSASKSGRGRKFSSASSQYGYVSTPSVTGKPLTLFAIVKTTSSGSKAQVSLGQTAGGLERFVLFYDAVAGCYSTSTIPDGSGIASQISSSINVEKSICGVSTPGSPAIVYVDGVANTGTMVWSPTVAVDRLYFAARMNSTVGAFADAEIVVTYVWHRALSDTEIKSLSANPWQIFKPLPRRIFAPVATSSDILGTLSITEGTETLSASGTVTGAASVDGTANLTESAETVTASGAVLVSGSSSTTNAAQSVTASGAVAISGTASLTETAETLSASGALAIDGVATVTESAETLTASGVVVSGIVGNASITEAEETVSASGAIAIGGTASIAPTAQDVIATGSIAITGTANLYELAETLIASGIALGGITGSASLSQAAQTLSAFATAAFPTIARPTSDVSNAGWTASTGTDLFAMLDEVSPDDADYISTSTLGAVCKMALNATQYPGSAAQQLSLRASSSTGNGLAVTIKDGATTIATRSLTLTPTYDLHTITLTSGEIAAITSGNLTVEMTSI